MFQPQDVEPTKGSELIPDGSFVKVKMAIHRGGVDGFSGIDKGLLKASKVPGSDVLLLDCEFTVVDGPLARRRFRQRFIVAGGKVDDQGASIGWTISLRIFRAMIDSAFGLDPDDMSEAAKAKRRLRGLTDLDGITFVAKVTIEPSNDPRYPDRNRLDHPVLPTEKEWRAVMNGEHVSPCSPKPQPAVKSRDACGPTSATAGASLNHSDARVAPAPQPTTSAAQSVRTTRPVGPAWLNG